MSERQHERQHRAMVGDGNAPLEAITPLRGARVMGVFWPMVRGVIKGALIFGFAGCGFAFWMGWASFGLADDARMACRRIVPGESFADVRADARSRALPPTQIVDHGLSFQVVAKTASADRPARCEVQADRGKVLHATYRAGG
jgi:hypothetical protein